VLENHSKTAVLRRECGYISAVKKHTSGVGRFVPSGHSQRGGFAGTRRSNKRHQFSLVHRERNVINRYLLAEPARESGQLE
jgi:hypothetical protein